MSARIATDLPPCPCCKLPAEFTDTVGGFVCYGCANEKCEQYPATAYHPTEAAARAEWMEIANPKPQA